MKKYKWVGKIGRLICVVLALCVCVSCSKVRHEDQKTYKLEDYVNRGDASTPEPASAVDEITEVVAEEDDQEPVTYKVTSEMSADDILSLADMSSLMYIDAKDSDEYLAIHYLQDVMPDTSVEWVFREGGEVYSPEVTSIAISEHDKVSVALTVLENLRSIDLLGIDVTVEDLDKWYEIRPDVFYLCNMSFGKWSVRTDLTIFSTLQPGSVDIHRYTDDEMYPLFKYCKKLRALDVGHNDLVDMTLIGELSDLQILIIGDNPHIVDISPLANLKELWYLEAFMTDGVEDFTPLSECTKMVDINIGYNHNVDNLSFLDTMPNIINGWFLGNEGITTAEIRKYEAMYPDATLIYGKAPGKPDSMAYGWRSTVRNTAIRKAFTNWKSVIEFRAWDDVDYLDIQKNGK